MFRLILVATLIAAGGLTMPSAEARPHSDEYGRVRVKQPWLAKVQAQQRQFRTARNLQIQWNGRARSRNVRFLGLRSLGGGWAQMKLALPSGDRSAPLLRRAAKSRQPLRRVVFSMFAADGKPVRIIGHHVIIIGYQPGSTAAGEGRPICYLKYKLEP